MSPDTFSSVLNGLQARHSGAFVNDVIQTGLEAPHGARFVTLGNFSSIKILITKIYVIDYLSDNAKIQRRERHFYIQTTEHKTATTQEQYTTNNKNQTICWYNEHLDPHHDGKSVLWRFPYIEVLKLHLRKNNPWVIPILLVSGNDRICPWQIRTGCVPG